MTTCRTCNGTGIVQCVEQDGCGAYEEVCPEPVHSTAETDAAVAAMMQRGTTMEEAPF